MSFLSYMWLNTAKAFAYEMLLVSLAFIAVVTLRSPNKLYVKQQTLQSFLKFVASLFLFSPCRLKDSHVVCWLGGNKSSLLGLA